MSLVPLARAATFEVNTPADHVDVAPGDGTCAGAAGLPCSMRAAVMEANAWPGPDEILVVGVHLLDIDGNDEDAAARGDLDITDELFILGAGPGVTDLSCATGDRVLDIAPGVTVRLQDLGVVRSGLIPGDGGLIRVRDANLTLAGVELAWGQAGRGGAMFVSGAASGAQVTFEGACVIADCHAREGGGLFLEGGASAVVATLSDVHVTRCTATERGGGIAMDQATLLGTAVVLDACDVSGTAASGGGGIDARGGLIVLGSSSVSSNQSGGDGGGIRSTGSVELSDVVVTGNRAALDGGGLWLAGDVTVSRCSIANNVAASRGGGVLLDGAVASCNASTISGNRLEGAAVAGGGLFSRSGDARLTNVTISGNIAADPGTGGGLAIESGSVRLANVTIARNVASRGGGLWTSGAADMSCSVFSGNVAAAGGPSCFGSLGALGPSLLDDASDCALTGDSTRVITGLEALLWPLGAYGGSTLTHYAPPESPLVDAGDAATCTDAFGAPLLVDQRGETRPGDGRGDLVPEHDLGAVEIAESCFADTDDDGWCDLNDTCPRVVDPGQEDRDGDGAGDACDPCPADPADTCPVIAILRNAELTALTLARHAELLAAGRDPVLDPVRDLYLPGAFGLSQVVIPGDAAPTSGPLVFYEAFGSTGPLRVQVAGTDIVLTGY